MNKKNTWIVEFSLNVLLNSLNRNKIEIALFVETSSIFIEREIYFQPISDTHTV